MPSQRRYKLSETHDGFLVREHKPFLKWLLIALAAVLLIITFFIGRWDQDRTLHDSYEMIEEMNVAINALTERNNDLVTKNARLSSGSKVDRDAYSSVNVSLVSLQREILSLKEELVFYRGIVSPAQTDLGVNLQELSVLSTLKDDEYRFKIVLTKSGRSKYSVRGEVSVSVTGLIDGKSKSFTLNELSEDSKSKLKYSFRYFQIFEQAIQLPAEFYPEVVTVAIKSKTRKVKSIESTFNWAELVSGEI